MDFVLKRKGTGVNNTTLEQFKRVFPNSEIDTNIKISEKSHIFSALLSKIAQVKEEGISLTELTEFIENYIKENNYSEGLGKPCIWTLVGFELIHIDRSKPESVVFLKELIK